MARTHYLVGGAAALVAAAVITACTDSKQIVKQESVDPMFQSYASLGNSVTAGYQSGGINDSTQQMSYAVRFAQQVNTRFAIPLLAMPGCAPPIDNFLTLTRVTPVGYPPSTASSCYLREQSSVTPTVNNLAVPGAASIDPVSLTSGNSNALTTFILGGSTQVARAAQLNPTFVSLWIGNNDVLSNALSGFLVKTTPNAPFQATTMTTVPTFTKNYAADVNALRGISSIKGGILFAVLNVTNLPTLFQASLLHTNPVDSAEFAAAAGGPFVLDASCYNPVPLINIQMAASIASGALPPIVICKKGVYPAPVGDLFVLDSAEVPTVIATIDGYNAYIAAKADSIGWAYIDVNPALAALKLSGAVPSFPVLSPTDPFGSYFSLDGVHPSGLGQQTVADSMISVVNAFYGKSIPLVP